MSNHNMCMYELLGQINKPICVNPLFSFSQNLRTIWYALYHCYLLSAFSCVVHTPMPLLCSLPTCSLGWAVLSSWWPDGRWQLIVPTSRVVHCWRAIVVQMVQETYWGRGLPQMGQKFIVGEVLQGILGVRVLTWKQTKNKRYRGSEI